MVNHLVQHIVLSVLRHQLQHVDVLTVVINAMGLQHLCIKVYLLKIYLNQNVMILVGGSDNNDYLFLTARNLKIMISDLPVGTHLRVRTSNNNNHSIVLAGKTDTTITVYDANGCGSNSSLLEAGSSNYPGHCQINKQVFTYKNFAKRYPRLDYMHKGA